MYGEKVSTHTQKKALHHWIVLQISHLVAIPFSATLLGEMLAEVRDVLHDIGVKAAWRSAMYNFAQKTVSLLLFISISCLSFSFFCVFILPYFYFFLYTSFSYEHQRMRLCVVSWREFCSFVSSSNIQFSTSSSYKWENGNCLLFRRGYMIHVKKNKKKRVDYI